MEVPIYLQSEALVQAEFYCNCKSLGMNVALQVTVPVGFLDVAIFNSDWTRLLAIVECKRMTRIGPDVGYWQMERYKRLGVPVHKLNSRDSMGLARAIKDSEHVGVAWEVIKAMPRRKRRIRINGRLRSRTIDPLELDEDVNFRA